MDAVKSTFSIKDLENLSGVKAHTIRIWEKRYSLFNPSRTPTNIRFYTLRDLQKILNVTYLLDRGFKISKIAGLSDAEIAQNVAERVVQNESQKHYQLINSFKIAMMNFDQQLFAETYKQAMDHMEFDEVFYEVFIPLLEEIGLLWQAHTIDPSHEHFIANLITQKILLNIEIHQRQFRPSKKEKFVLFLPENEMHDLGLLFLNYVIVREGYAGIYLGQSIKLENLKYLRHHDEAVNFVTYLTVKPDTISVAEYVDRFNKELDAFDFPLYLLGRKAGDASLEKLAPNAHITPSIPEFINQLSQRG
ncbi:MAG: MerR family transcriptional regulator [Leeuwenhoekiella sp.]